MALLSAKQIGANGKGQIEVTVDTRGIKDGPLEKTVLIKTNDPQRPNIILTIKAESEPDVILSERSINLGTVRKDSTTFREIILTLLRPIKIIGVKSSNPNAIVTLTPNVESSGRQYKLMLVYKAAEATGYHISEIIIKTTSRTLAEIRIPVARVVVN